MNEIEKNILFFKFFFVAQTRLSAQSSEKYVDAMELPEAVI